MEINGKTYRNLESQVAYLTDVWNNQVALNEMGIKVVGHVDTETEIPDGTYEYGDAYMVGTEVPYTMYVWTRADLSHTTDYWFNVGKFPLPGPHGEQGDTTELNQVDSTSNTTVALTDNGITHTLTGRAIYSNGDERNISIDEITPLTFNANDFSPVTSDNKVTLDLNHTKLATKYYPMQSGVNRVPYVNKSGTMGSLQVIADTAQNWSIVQRDGNGKIVANQFDGSLSGDYANIKRVYYVDIDKKYYASRNITDINRGTASSVYSLLNSDNFGDTQYITYTNGTTTDAKLPKLFNNRTDPPMNILMTDEEVFNSTTYPNKKGILHLSNYQCPISGLHEYTYTTQIPGYYIVYKITDESNGQDTSSDLWSMNRSIYKMGTEVQPSEM